MDASNFSVKKVQGERLHAGGGGDVLSK